MPELDEGFWKHIVETKTDTPVTGPYHVTVSQLKALKAVRTGVAILPPESLGFVYIGRAGIADLNYRSSQDVIGCKSRCRRE
jgi:hypothetical protein